LRAAVLPIGLALTVAVAGCGGGDDSAAVTAPLGAGGETIPRTTGATTTETPVSTPTTATTAGGPKVRQFAAPKRFFCLSAHPNQTQVTIGWSAPSADAVDVRLDGKRLHSGIRKALPFAVPAGPASGIGSTIVFPCRPARAHTVTIRWRTGSSVLAERTVKITRAKGT
jgi:hypothetical protein